MDYLTGKYLKATKRIPLSYRAVNGQLYSNSTIYVPEISKGQCVKVLRVEDEVVTLQNLDSSNWVTCELTLSDIEEFKVISSSQIFDLE